MASQRARHIAGGAPLSIDRDNDKNPVVSLREIADETIDLNELEESVIRNLQRHVEIDEPEDDEIALDTVEENLSIEDNKNNVAEIEQGAADIIGSDIETNPDLK